MVFENRIQERRTMVPSSFLSTVYEDEEEQARRNV